MKKIAFTLIAALLAASLTACSGGASTPDATSASDTGASSESQSSSESSSESSSLPSEPEYEKAKFSSLKVINNLGFTVTGLYLSPTHANTWEENVLSDKTLPTGYSTDVSFPDGENARYWDVRIVGESNQEVVWYEFDLSAVGTIDLIISNGQMTAETYKR